MYFDSIDQALFMNGHGIYVWSIYLLFFIVMTGFILSCYRQHGRIRHQIGALRKAQDHRSQNKKT